MKQITIVAPATGNLVGAIAAVLAAENINIDTFTADSVAGLDVMVLTVDRYDDALRAVHRAGYKAITEDAILVRLADEPGALATITRRFQEAALPIRSIRIINRSSTGAVVAIAVERTDEALAIVRDIIIA